jgi:hypothetical protein
MLKRIPLRGARRGLICGCFVYLFGTISPTAGHSQVPRGQDLTVHSGANRVEIRRGEAVRLWLTFENQGQSILRSIHISDCWHEGFEPAECWGQSPTCTAAGDRISYPLELEAGEATSVIGDLRALRWGNKQANLVCMITWRDSSGRAHQRAVSFPPIETLDFWSTFDRGLLGLLKDLALPIVLLILGVVFRSTEQRRAALQETWNQMLEKSHKNAERHYMPVSAALLRLRTSYDDLPEEALKQKALRDQDLRLIFADFLVLLVRVRRLVRAIGGFYFKDREGEALAAAVWYQFRSVMENKVDRVRLESVVIVLGSRDEAASVNDRLRKLEEKEKEEAGSGTARASSLPYTKTCRAFEKWIYSGSFLETLTLLRALELLLDYEMNRPYKPWYGSPESFPRRDFDETLESLKRWAHLPESEASKAQRDSVDALAWRIRWYSRRERLRRWDRLHLIYRWVKWRRERASEREQGRRSAAAGSGGAGR